ncbi:hypothetical protein QYF36_008884 [Acer negundo]|nr:hypothetical protein QYF36_008884 [Acer negundo]
MVQERLAGRIVRRALDAVRSFGNHRRRPTTLRAYGVLARRSLPVVPSSPLAVWAFMMSAVSRHKLSILPFTGRSLESLKCILIL